jgi:hypothetical protein
MRDGLKMKGLVSIEDVGSTTAFLATGGRAHDGETAIERLSLRRSAHNEIEE